MRARTMAIVTTLASTAALAACGTNGDVPLAGDGGYASLDGGGIDCANGPDFTGCPCMPGDSKVCYTGPASTEGVGPCKAGTQTCVVSGELNYFYGPCTGEVVPSASLTCSGVGGGGSEDGGTGLGTGGGGGEDAGACNLAAPRLVAPLSTSTVTSQRPNLRWELPAGVTGAHVELCADRACKTVLQSFDASGSTGAPSAALPTGVSFWRAFGTAGGQRGCTPSATWEFFAGARSAPVNSAWGTFPDPNGDGYADPIIGDTVSAGTVPFKNIFVYPGSASGVSTTPATVLTPNSADMYQDFANAGDVDGDGFTDLVFVEVGATATLTVYRGGPAGLSTTPAWTITNPNPPLGITDFQTGPNGDVAGDINGDGYSDLALAGQGKVLVFFGSPSGPKPTPTALPSASQEPFPYGVGDINGDTFADVFAYPPLGEAYLGAFFLGGASGPSATPQTVKCNPTTLTCGDNGGLLGDVNGDGYADYLVDEDPTKMYVFPGSASGAGAAAQALLPPAGSLFFGDEFAGPGDVDGDGYEDVLISDEIAANSYVVRFFKGGNGSVSASPASTIPLPTMPTGVRGRPFAGIARTGDVNGDHLWDLLMWESDGVHVLLGTPTGPASNGVVLPGNYIHANGS